MSMSQKRLEEFGSFRDVFSRSQMIAPEFESAVEDVLFARQFVARALAGIDQLSIGGSYFVENPCDELVPRKELRQYSGKLVSGPAVGNQRRGPLPKGAKKVSKNTPEK